MQKQLDSGMEGPLEELQLKDSYEFSVSIDDGGHIFAGELQLNPDACSLVIRGDVSQGRATSFGWDDVSLLKCSGHAGTFFLYGLKFCGGHTRHLQHHPTSVTHFENRYDVSHVVYGRATLFGDPSFYFVDFYSPSIGQWVGYTTTQDEIVKRYHNDTLFPYSSDTFAEFLQPVSDFGDVAVLYYPSTAYSLTNFSTGLEFAPILSIALERAAGAVDVIATVDSIDILFSFLCGAQLDIDKIRLTTADGRRVPLSLYFPRKPERYAPRKYPFFPLGKNLRMDTLGLPSLPIELFSEYFRLSEGERRLFSKYVKYRNLENPEERFLGFFRLLEKLCFKKESFLDEVKISELIKRSERFLINYFGDKKNVKRVLRRMPGWNGSKLNTAACINRFLQTLPMDLRGRWIYDHNDIDDICKLRNDLTHANAVEPEAYEIEKKAKFIEALLVVRLLVVLGVPIESAAKLVPRLSGHFLAEKPLEVRVTLRETEPDA